MSEQTTIIRTVTTKTVNLESPRDYLEVYETNFIKSSNGKTRDGVVSRNYQDGGVY